jgi:hypothetical protein
MVASALWLRVRASAEAIDVLARDDLTETPN